MHLFGFDLLAKNVVAALFVRFEFLCGFAEILANSGTQFDPTVVAAFMQIPLEALLRIAPDEAAEPVAEVAVA